MDLEQSHTRLFARLSAFTIIAHSISLVICFILGILLTGHIPIPSVDIDPYGTNSFLLNFFQFINIILAIASFIALPTWLLLMIHLLIIGNGAIKKDYRVWILTVISIVAYLILRQTPTFQWLMD